MRDDVSGPSGVFVDPLKLKPMRLSVGTVQHLVEKRYFPVHASSPLVPLTKLPCPPDQKNGKQLPKLGLPVEPQADVRLGGRGRAYLDALMIAATPEARLEVSELVPSGSGSMAMDIVLGQEKAAIVDIDTEGLSITPPLALNDLLRPLVRHVQNTDADIGKANVWQSQLRIIGWVFASVTKMPRALFEERIATAAKLSPADSAKVADELLGASLLLAEGTNLSLSKPLTAFVERTSFGQVVELLFTPYDAKGKPGERRELRFFGKPNDRITVLTSMGAMLKADLGGTEEPPEPALISIMTMPSTELRRLVESFVGMG